MVKQFLKEKKINTFFYKIKTGTVHVKKFFHKDKNGIIIGSYKDGDIFGETCLLMRKYPNRQSTVEIVAYGDVEVYRIHCIDVMKLCDENNLIGAKLYRLLCKKLSIRINSIGDVNSHKEVEEQMSSVGSKEESTSGDNQILKKFKIKDQSVIREFGGVKRIYKNNSTKGTMYITQDYICFLGVNIFAIEKREKILFEVIEDVQVDSTSGIITLYHEEKKTDFTFQEDISNVSQHIIRIWKLSQNRGSQSQNIDEPKTKKKEKEQEVIDISQVKKMFPKKAELKTLIDNSKQCTLKKKEI